MSKEKEEMRFKTLFCVAVFSVFVSCNSYLQELQIFPQCQILKIGLPMECSPDDVHYWTIYVNTAPDSLMVKMFYQQTVGIDFLLLPPKRLKFEHGVHPMSWITCPWGLDTEGRIRFEFTVWNRYNKVTLNRWVTIKKKNQPALKFKFF